jgi:hypothetical protein
VIDGLTHQGAGAAVQIGYWNAPIGENVEVRNCNIKHSWQYAIRMDQRRNTVVDNCEIESSGLSNFPRARYLREFDGSYVRNAQGNPKRTDWPVAIIGWNADGVSVTNSYIHDNHGEGVGPFLQSSDWTIRGNVVADNWSVNIYSSTQDGDVRIENNTVFNTGGKWVNDVEDGDTYPNPKQADGIRVANEASDLSGWLDVEIDRITINNLVVATAGGINAFRYGRYPKMILRDSVIANNTVATWTAGAKSGSAIFVEAADNVTVANNIVQGGKLNVSGLNRGLNAFNNMAPDGFSKGSGVNEAGTISQAPSFVGQYSGGPEAFRLNPGSPGDNTGVQVNEVPTDMTGRGRNNPPDIGALEN